MPKKLPTDCFDIVNVNGKPVLFRTDNVAINRFTFTIANTTNDPLVLRGGKPDTAIRARLAATSEASTFSFDFEAMLTPDIMAGLTLDLPAGWTAAYSPGEGSTPPSWALAPEHTITLAVNDRIEFYIGNIKCADTRPGNFEIMYRNIPDYPDLQFAMPKHLDVLNPPDPQKKTLPLKDGYINPIHPIGGQTITPIAETGEGVEAVPVYITYDATALIENGFTFILTNTNKTPLVPPGAAAGNEAPVLYISFVFGDEEYAITSQSLGDNNITIDVNAKLPWQPTAHTGGTSYWQFSPQSSQIMEGLETIQFPIKKIITPLNIPADSISLLYIQFNNVPGYNDAVYTVQMHKRKAEAKMEKLEADKRVITYGENIKLSWESSLAKRVTIEYDTRDKKRILLDSAKGDIKLNGTQFLLPVAPSAEYTIITATAYDNSSVTSTKDITITVNQVQASIGYFRAESTLVRQGGKTDVQLYWATENAQTLRLITPEGEEDVTGRSNIVKQVGAAFTFILEAWSYGTHFPAPVKARRKIYTWDHPGDISLAMSREIAQASPAIASSNRLSRVFTFNSVANNIYVIDSKNGTLVQALPAVGMAWHDKEARLFTFVNAGAFFALVMYDVSSGQPVEKARVNLTYEYVHKMVVLPDLSALLCTVTYEHRGKMRENYIVKVLINTGNNTLTISGRTQLNNIKNFNGNIALAANGLPKAFVIIDTTRIAAVWTNNLSLGATITLPFTDPDLLLCTKYDRLFVASTSKGSLATINTVTDNVDNVRHDALAPDMILSPDGECVCLAAPTGRAVVLLDARSTEVREIFDIRGTPFGLCFSPDGKYLLVTNYCNKTVEVIDYLSKELLEPALPTGTTDGNPFAVAAVDDGTNIRVVVSKESWPQRLTCANPVTNTTDNITVYSILKPDTSDE